MRWTTADRLTVGAATLAGLALRAFLPQPDLKSFTLQASSCGQFKVVSTSPNVEIKAFQNTSTDVQKTEDGGSTVYFTLDEHGEGYVSVINRLSDAPNGKSILYSYHLQGSASPDLKTQCCNPAAFQDESVTITAYRPAVGWYDDLVENKAWSSDTAPTFEQMSNDVWSTVSQHIHAPDIPDGSKFGRETSDRDTAPNERASCRI